MRSRATIDRSSHVERESSAVRSESPRGRRSRAANKTNGSMGPLLVALTLGILAVRPLLDVGPTYGVGPDLNMLAGAGLILSMLSWAWTERDSLARPSTAVLSAFLLGLAAVLSALGSISPVSSLLLALRVVTIVMLFAFAEQAQRRYPTTIWFVLCAVLVSASFAGLVGAIQTLGFIPLPEQAVTSLDADLLRPPGPYPAAPVFSTHLFVGLLAAAIAAAVVSTTERWRFLSLHLAALAGVFLWLMIANRSRSPIVAAAAALGVFLVLRFRWKGIAFWAVLALGAFAALDPGTVRADELGAGAEAGAEADTFAWRVGYWQANLPRFWDNPATGIGLGRVSQLNSGGNPPHSTVVQATVEMGLAGVISYAAFAITLGWGLFIGYVRRADRRAQIVQAGALSLCVGYFMIGLSENLLTQVVTSGPVAVIAGAAIGLGTRRPVAATA